MTYNFNIIHDQQTPRVDLITDVKKYIEFKDNKEVIDEFLKYATGITHRGLDGIGLAANQCSLNGERFMERMFAKMDLKTKEWEVIINPIIVNLGGKIDNKKELCLTWGMEQMVVADRYYKVIAEYYDIHGMKHTVEESGFKAQLWQHEVNHLDGVEELLKSSKNYSSRSLVGRNDLCPCGSGKKYKKCCINN